MFRFLGKITYTRLQSQRFPKHNKNKNAVFVHNQKSCITLYRRKIKKIINSREIVKKKVNLLIKINIRELLGVLPKDKIHEDQK